MKPPATDPAITVYPPGIKLRLAPDAPEAPWPDNLPLPHSIGVFEFKRNDDGSYTPIIKMHTRWLRLSVKGIEELALGIGYNSMRRLMRAGFVKFMQITPGQYAVDLQSYFQHVAAVRADCEFWTGKNLKRYMEAY